MRFSKVFCILAIGNKSFWKPYFDIFPKADLLPLWATEEMDELQDPELKQEAIRYKEEIDKEWNLAKLLFSKYPDIFPNDKVHKDLFVFVYGNVVTRCFGWSLPCTMMIPVADSMNHWSVDGSNEVFDTFLHKKAAGKLKPFKDPDLDLYSTKIKMGLDFSDLTKTHIQGEAGGIVIKPLIIDNDIVKICNKNEDININRTEYNIWNMYNFL